MSESLSQKTFKNALWQVFNLGWVTILNFFVTPILLQKIGIENYGVYVLVLTIISFLSLLDIGMGAGFASSFIEYTAAKEKEKRNKLVNSFIWLRTGIGLAGFLFLFSLSFFVSQIFDIRGEFLRQTQYGFWVAGLYFAVLMVSTPFSGLAIAAQRFDILGKAAFVQNTILNISLIAFAFFRPSLTWLLASHFLAGAANFLICFFMTRKILPEFKFRFEFSFGDFSKKIRFGFYNFISSIANNSLMQIDRFFVSKILGNSFLAFYTIPNSLAQKIYSVSSSSAAVLYPVTTNVFYQGETQRFSQSFRRAMRLAMIFSVFSGAILLIFGRELLDYWVGSEISQKSASLLYFFVPTYVLFSIYEVISSFYFGAGKTRTPAFFSVFMALLNVALLIFLIPQLDLTGAALAYLLALLPVVVLLFVFEKQELGLRDGLSFYLILLAKILTAILIFYLPARFFLFNLAQGLWQTLLLMIFSFAAIMGLYAGLGFVEKEDWELVKSFLNKRK